jgi:uncharacterized protein YbbK (DUF523 family)
MMNQPKRLCSACLLGVTCRYDGKRPPDARVIDLMDTELLIPVCPEQLGGLTTPRERAEIRDGQVVTESGRDVTAEFQRGAEEVLKIAKLLGVERAILKQRSPSCGCGKIFDGTFAHKLKDGDGITAKLLKEHGIEVISEEDLPEP